jgi:hypothetical protein
VSERGAGGACPPSNIPRTKNQRLRYAPQQRASSTSHQATSRTARLSAPRGTSMAVLLSKCSLKYEMGGPRCFDSLYAVGEARRGVCLWNWRKALQAPTRDALIWKHVVSKPSVRPSVSLTKDKAIPLVILASPRCRFHSTCQFVALTFMRKERERRGSARTLGPSRPRRRTLLLAVAIGVAW